MRKARGLTQRVAVMDRLIGCDDPVSCRPWDRAPASWAYAIGYRSRLLPLLLGTCHQDAGGEGVQYAIGNLCPTRPILCPRLAGTGPLARNRHNSTSGGLAG